MTDKDQILAWLEEVKDPEIPVLSLVDLGVITSVETDGKRVKVEMTPTFVGCPAMEVMRQDVIDVLKKYGITDIEVDVNFKKSWSSDNISEKGKKALKSFGLAPPQHNALINDIDFLEHVACPRCEGTNTVLKNPFGPTLCRSIHYCNDCRDAFEQFKPV